MTDSIPNSVTPPVKAPLLSRSLLLFMFAMILANIGGSMYHPLLPLYLQELGANVGQVGLFFTLSQVIPLALQILGGWVSDSLGRLRAVAFGSVAGLFTYLFLIISPRWEWVLLSMAFGAVSGSLIGPSFDAYIAENSTRQNRARVFGVTQALFQIVGVIGPLLGGWLAQVRGFKFMLGVAAVLYVAATLLRIGMARHASRSPEARARKLSFEGLKQNLGTMFGLVTAGGVITWVLITDGVRDISFALSFNFMPIYMQDIAHLSLPQIGLMNSLFSLFLMLSTIPGGLLADRKGERIGIVTGFAMIFIALMIFVSTVNFWLYCVGWAVAGIGVGVMSPAYQSLISKAVPARVRGTAFGLFSTSLGLVSLPAPAIGAQLWERISPRFPFQITAWVSLICVIPAWLKFKLNQKDEISEMEDENNHG